MGSRDAVYRSAVFLDRDGVVNATIRRGGSERPPWSLDEVEVVPGARCALATLRAAGFRVVLVTNQPDVGHGRLNAEAARRINSAVAIAVGADQGYLCPHTDADHCSCRKPRPGMLVRGAADLGVDLSRSWMVGDRWVDIAAGQAVGVRTILVSRDVSWRPTSAGGPPVGLRPTAVAPTVVAAVDIVLAGHHQEE
jgi:D-glycero-D-manno-heptose 1,7-bisphosphate phosphatase